MVGHAPTVIAEICSQASLAERRDVILQWDSRIKAFYNYSLLLKSSSKISSFASGKHYIPIANERKLSISQA